MRLSPLLFLSLTFLDCDVHVAVTPAFLSWDIDVRHAGRKAYTLQPTPWGPYPCWNYIQLLLFVYFIGSFAVYTFYVTYIFLSSGVSDFHSPSYASDLNTHARNEKNCNTLRPIWIRRCTRNMLKFWSVNTTFDFRKISTHLQSLLTQKK